MFTRFSKKGLLFYVVAVVAVVEQFDMLLVSLYQVMLEGCLGNICSEDSLLHN